MTDAAPDFATLTVSEAEGVVAVTLDHPPVNLLDAAMLGDLARRVGEL
jgi:enoyl-CoA hydratase/carnithine racemase